MKEGKKLLNRLQNQDTLCHEICKYIVDFLEITFILLPNIYFLWTGLANKKTRVIVHFNYFWNFRVFSS
jgi:hypothetical protein